MDVRVKAAKADLRLGDDGLLAGDILGPRAAAGLDVFGVRAGLAVDGVGGVSLPLLVAAVGGALREGGAIADDAEDGELGGLAGGGEGGSGSEQGACDRRGGRPAVKLRGGRGAKRRVVRRRHERGNT